MRLHIWPRQLVSPRCTTAGEQLDSSFLLYPRIPPPPFVSPLVSSRSPLPNGVRDAFIPTLVHSRGLPCIGEIIEGAARFSRSARVDITFSQSTRSESGYSLEGSTWSDISSRQIDIIEGLMLFRSARLKAGNNIG